MNLLQRFLLLFLVGISSRIGVSADSNSCSVLGFKETLICSTCDQLESYIKDQELIDDCKRCCAEEKDASVAKLLYKHITLQVCS